MTPRVSIVVPTYNRAQDLERALRSAQAQTFTAWEAVVVDNHSSDDTDEIIRSLDDARIRLFKIHNHGVIAASRNLGIQQSLGQFVAFLDSDDWWSPRKLEEAIVALDGGADVVHHDLFVAVKSRQRYHHRRSKGRQLDSPVFEDLLANGNALPNSSVVVRRELLQQVGGLCEEPSLIALEDFDTWLRIATLTDRFAYIPQVLGYYWLGGGNMTNPRRTLQALAALEARHAEGFSRLRAVGGCYWLLYARGRAHYSLRASGQAVCQLRQLPWRTTPWPVAVKAAWMLAISRLRLMSGLDRAEA